MSDRWSSLAILHLVPVKRRSIPRLAPYCTWNLNMSQVEKDNIIYFLYFELLIDQKPININTVN